MKPWQLNRRVNSLSQEIADPVKTDTKIDWNCLSEPERQLIDKIREISDKYAPGIPPQDLINKNADLWYKGLEIFARRATDLFVQLLPDALCCDELEEWYFKLYFYNFWHDWMDSIRKVRDMPEEQRMALLCERREMGLLDMVFRLPRSQPETTKKQKATRCHER
jgi:hypothetical protein